MIEYSPEDLERLAPNAITLPKLMAAEKAGKNDEVAKLRREMIYDVNSLLFLRDSKGIDWITEQGLNTSEAEHYYGPNWETCDVL